MAYCLRNLPLAAQLLIDDFRRHWLDLAYLCASGGTPSARAMKSVRWQRRRLHPDRRYNTQVLRFFGDRCGNGLWRLRADWRLGHCFIGLLNADAEPGDPEYGRARRGNELPLWHTPTDDSDDDEHYSIGWLSEDFLSHLTEDEGEELSEDEGEVGL